MARAPCDWLDTRLAKSYVRHCNHFVLMATRTDFLLKNVAKQNQIPDVDVSLPCRAVACGLQNYTGPEHTCPPTAGNFANEKYSPVDFIGTGRIRATGNLQDQRDQSVDSIGTGRSSAAANRKKIEDQSDTFA